MNDDLHPGNGTVAFLLKTLNEAGIKIKCANSELLIQYPKGSSIDPALLEEVKRSKDSLLEHFQQYDEGNSIDALLRMPVKELAYNGSIYYEISPTQVYWLNENIDREYKLLNKMHGTCMLTFEVVGNGFDPAVFEQAVLYLVRRHESLRATFHYIGNAWLMKVEEMDLPRYAPVIISMVEQEGAFPDLDDIAGFEGHKFDLSNGPLFLARIIRAGAAKYVIAIKVHHVLFDGLSLQILIRDLLQAYYSYANNKEVLLPELKCQYKEFLALSNRLAEKNREAHRRFWYGKFPGPPCEFLIPGVERVNNDMSRKICREEIVEFAPGTIAWMISLTKQFNVSLFVILQALFNALLLYKMDKNDVLIGTYVFGRDFAGSEDQIGCYAKTVLMRTVLDRQEPFPGIVEKVKRANEDTLKYTAFSLRDMLEETAPPEHMKGTCFQNVNLLYADVSTEPDYSRGRLALGFSMRPLRGKPGVPVTSIDLRLFFISYQNTLKVKFQYDESLYSAEIIRHFARQYITCAEEIAEQKIFF